MKPYFSWSIEITSLNGLSSTVYNLVISDRCLSHSDTCNAGALNVASTTRDVVSDMLAVSYRQSSRDGRQMETGSPLSVLNVDFIPWIA